MIWRTTLLTTRHNGSPAVDYDITRKILIKLLNVVLHCCVFQMSCFVLYVQSKCHMLFDLLFCMSCVALKAQHMTVQGMTMQCNIQHNIDQLSFLLIFPCISYLGTQHTKWAPENLDWNCYMKICGEPYYQKMSK